VPRLLLWDCDGVIVDSIDECLLTAYKAFLRFQDKDDALVQQLHQIPSDLLFQQKAMIEHKYFTRWIKENMPLSPRTAQRYMKLYEYKETLTKMHVETITEAYHKIFNWNTSDEVVEVNDSVDDKGTITYSDDATDKPKSPKHTTRGRIERVEVSRKFIDDVVAGKILVAGNEVYCKFVIEINSNTVASDTGDLIKALEPKLRPGGKIILVKK
jgi:hypothetical protein